MNYADKALDDILDAVQVSKMMEEKDEHRAYLYLIAAIRRSLYNFETKIHYSEMVDE